MYFLFIYIIFRILGRKILNLWSLNLRPLTGGIGMNLKLVLSPPVQAEGLNIMNKIINKDMKEVDMEPETPNTELDTVLTIHPVIDTQKVELDIQLVDLDIQIMVPDIQAEALVIPKAAVDFHPQVLDILMPDLDILLEEVDILLMVPGTEDLVRISAIIQVNFIIINSFFFFFCHSIHFGIIEDKLGK